MLKHYVEFDTPGFFMPESEVRLVKSRVPAQLKKIPKNTYAIEYFDREEIKKDNEVLSSNAKNRSKRILFGKIYTKEDLIKKGFGEHTPLYHNADNTNGRVVQCITGNWQPCNSNYIILDSYKSLETLTTKI
jgi:hypothetical protein